MTLEGVIPLLPVVRERDCDPLSNGGLAPPPPPPPPRPGPGFPFAGVPRAGWGAKSFFFKG